MGKGNRRKMGLLFSRAPVPTGTGASVSKLVGDIMVDVVTPAPGVAKTKEVLAQSLWKDQKTVVHLLRRFG